MASDDKSIFESYAWKDAKKIAEKIKSSLKEAGYDVYFDSDKLNPKDPHFSSMLEEAIQKHQIVVALLSPHSVRLEGDIAIASRMSVCHNELILASRLDKTVIPVTVIECRPPFAINIYDPIDFTNWSSPEAYQAGIQEILQWIAAGLENPPRRRYLIAIDRLPHDRLSFWEELTAENDFVGRNWLMERLEAWLVGGKGRCFLIEAEPGAGKTALVAELIRRNPGDRILAYHFCSSKDKDTTKSRRFVRSLAAMLCGTVPEYRERLRSSEDLVHALTNDNEAERMLWQGVLQPLRGLGMGGARCIVVDALDEAVNEPNREISVPQLLSQALDQFPPWLKLIATTRRDQQVLTQFQGVDQCFLGASIDAQQQDLRQYVESRFAQPELRKQCPNEAERLRIAKAIAEHSEGNFQYAAMVLDELRDGKLALDDINHLPPGLSKLYYQFATRRLPTSSDFEQASRVLGILLAAHQPLTQEQLILIAGLNQYGLVETFNKLGRFVTWDKSPGDELLYRVAHKSIGDWFVEPPEGDARKFKIDPAQGRALILGHCRGWAEHGERYALTDLIAHLIEAGLTEEALTAVRNGFFKARRGRVDPGYDLDDARALTLALIKDRNQSAILELAKTDNLWQRDGVAAGLQAAKPDDDDFVDRLVGALLAVRN
jgi:hypothetical protein